MNFYFLYITMEDKPTVQEISKLAFMQFHVLIATKLDIVPHQSNDSIFINISNLIDKYHHAIIGPSAFLKEFLWGLDLTKSQVIRSVIQFEWDLIPMISSLSMYCYGIAKKDFTRIASSVQGEIDLMIKLLSESIDDFLTNPERLWIGK